MVKGLSFLSLFSDCLIEEKLVLWVQWNIKRWTAVGYGKIICEVSRRTYCITPHKCYCRVILKHDLTQADFSKHELTKRFNVYLNFTITWRTNSLVYKRKLTNRQEKIYELIKSSMIVDLALDVLRRDYVIWNIKIARRMSLRIKTYSHS